MTTANKLKEISKFLSYVLRHKPEAIGLSMDEEGWVSIDKILEKSTKTSVIQDSHSFIKIS